MNIEELLNKYFEGETTCQEEREIRRYFAQEQVPEQLEVYRPLFAFFDKEQQQYQQATEVEVETLLIPTKTPFRRRMLYALSGLAAGLLLLLGVAGTIRYFTPQPDNYVIIDGKQYTDIALARQQAMAAFQDVSFSQEEVLDVLFEE